MFRTGVLIVLLFQLPMAVGLEDKRRSATELMTSANRAMQADMTIHPGSLWIMEGEQLWEERAVSGGKSCVMCHGDVSKAMKGVSATYPRVSAGRLRGLDDQINYCRVTRQGLSPLAPESRSLLSLTALVAYQSRGLPIAPDATSQALPYLEMGRQLFLKRMGQLNLSCAQCHDERAGLRLGGSIIPQGHPTGYPIYRIEWQNMGSLQRRLRSCMTGVRAERYDFNSQELLSLELYLMHRAKGMTIESPAVRP
jgi:sulfur-oxidizing protein SoxA